jgi:hypothetical protein
MGSPNAITNGFEFQYAAAIYIFLKYTREIQKIGLETGEDIEAILKNDQRIFAQAKSSNDGNALYSDDHTSTITDSLKTLSHNKGNIRELISIFNFHKPFGNKMNFQMNNSYRFSDLPSNVQDDLKRRTAKFNLDFNKISFWLLQYEGVNKLIALEEETKQQLNGIYALSEFRVKDLIDNWAKIFSLNASTKEIYVDANVLCGVLFGNIAGQINVDKLLAFLEINDFVVEETVSKIFKAYFSKRDLTYHQFNTISGDYITYLNDSTVKKTNTNQIIKNFIEEYCTLMNIPDYIKSLFSEYSEDSRQESEVTLFKVIVLFCIQKRDLMKKISEVFYGN